MRGGVVTADNKLSVDVGGDLTVESVQDKNKNHSNTVGVSGGSSGSGGANANISSGNKKWVTEQTSLTGEIVDIYVEDKTTLTGAVIASTTGDLTLDTGSLEFSNIKDKDISSNLGGGVNAGAGSESVNATYGFTDKRQTNFATIGEGTITVRDTEDTAVALEGLNRDVTIAQYNTKDGGLQGGFTVDKATINLIGKTVEAVQDPLLAGATIVCDTITTVGVMLDDMSERNDKIIAGAKDLEKQTEVIVEKSGNLVGSGHFTTDDKVQYYVNMDDYEAAKAAGGEITALDTLVYVKSKSAAGEELTRSDLSDLKLSSGIVLDGATDAIKENLAANIQTNSREEVFASLAVLDKYDSGDASEARSYLSGVREADKQTSVIGIDTVLPSVASNDGIVSESRSIHDVIEGWGQSLNTWGTEKNKAITDSGIVQTTHAAGEYLNANPDVALGVCIGAGALGIGLPILIDAAPVIASTGIGQTVIGKTASDQIINVTVASTNTVIYYATDKDPSIGGAALTFGESYAMSGVNTAIGGFNALNTAGKVILSGAADALIDLGIQGTQKELGYRDNIDKGQVVGSFVGGSTGTALTHVLPETTGKIINDLPTIWTQASTSGVVTSIPVMLSH